LTLFLLLLMHQRSEDSEDSAKVRLGTASTAIFGKACCFGIEVNSHGCLVSLARKRWVWPLNPAAN
jgi:hypothetical protein